MNDLSLIRKKLLYRSSYRGCKETDFLIGKFAAAKINEMDEKQLDTFDRLLSEDDAEIYDWILGKTEFPENYLKIIEEIRQLHKI